VRTHKVSAGRAIANEADTTRAADPG